MKHLLLVLLLGLGVGAVDAQTVDPCRADIDRSGTVDFRDFLFLADSFGKSRCGLYWLGEDIRLTIWDTLIVRDTLVVRETVRDTLVVTETFRDTLVLRETIRDTLYVVLAQPEQPQPPQPQPPPSPPQPQPEPSQPEPSPPPQPQPPATPTLSMDIIGFATAEGSPIDDIRQYSSNGFNDGKTSVTVPSNALWIVEVFLTGVDMSVPVSVELYPASGPIGYLSRRPDEVRGFGCRGLTVAHGNLTYGGSNGFCGFLNLWFYRNRDNVSGATFTYMPTATLAYYYREGGEEKVRRVSATVMPLTITATDEDRSRLFETTHFPCKTPPHRLERIRMGTDSSFGGRCNE